MSQKLPVSILFLVTSADQKLLGDSFTTATDLISEPNECISSDDMMNLKTEKVSKSIVITCLFRYQNKSEMTNSFWLYGVHAR